MKLGGFALKLTNCPSMIFAGNVVFFLLVFVVCCLIGKNHKIESEVFRKDESFFGWAAL